MNSHSIENKLNFLYFKIIHLFKKKKKNGNSILSKNYLYIKYMMADYYSKPVINPINVNKK